MANRQLEAFGELFISQEAITRYQNRDYSCPFDSRIDMCDKPNRGELRYGNCSVEKGNNKRIICPRRFYERDYKIIRDVKSFIFQTETAFECYDELQISIRVEDGDSFVYGNLDWIIVNPINIREFCGIEIQTDATTNTGRMRDGINDLLNNSLLESYNFGLNTLASFKGFLPQFIFKGQLFDDWKQPYVAILQDELWEKFISKFRIRYREISTYNGETFLFFIYSLILNPETNKYEIKNRRVFSSRWIDLLFSFSVESDLLIDRNGIITRIEQKMSRYDPRLII